MNITANLFIQHGLYYVILSYRDSNNKRKQKWIPTGITEKGNNKRLANCICQVNFGPLSN